MASNEIRQWLKDHNFAIGDYGPISTEFHDVHTAVTEGFVKPEDAIAYVDHVRKWIIGQGTVMTRAHSLTVHHFRKFEDAHPTRTITSATFTVSTPEPHDQTKENDVPSIHDLPDSRDSEVSPEDIRISTEAVKPLLAGTEFVTNEMNRTFITLTRTALQEAITLSYDAFQANGAIRDEGPDTVEVLNEVKSLTQMATSFLEDLLKTFHAPPTDATSYSDSWKSSLVTIPLRKMKRTSEYGKSSPLADGLDEFLRDFLGVKEGEAEDGKSPLLGTTFQGITMDFDFPELGNNVSCTSPSGVSLTGMIEARSVDEHDLYLIHWFDKTENVHKWVYKDAFN